MLENKTAVVVGVGRMGLRHIEACQSLGVKVTGLCDVSSKAIENAVITYQLSQTAHNVDIEALLSKCKPDIIIISTTADSHYNYVVHAAKMKVPFIFCEKPMATSVAECEEMLDICKKNSSKLCINHFHRFNPLYKKIKSLIEGGKIGGIGSVNVISGNMGLAMNGSHFFEIFRVFTGELPEKVSGVLCDDIVSNPRGAQFIDRAGTIKAVSCSGIRFYLEASSDQGHGIQIIISGSYGNIYCDVLNGYIRVMHRKDEYKTQPTVQYALPEALEEIKMGASDLIKMTASMLKSFLDNDDYFSGDQGLKIIELLACSHYSNKNSHKLISPLDLNAQEKALKYAWA